jgi:cobalt-zinc-cadmium efflux system outer membrane protein
MNSRVCGFIVWILVWGAVPSDAQAPGGLPTGTAVTLQECKEIALRNSPDLASAAADLRAARGAARQARSLLNPTLEVGRDDFGGESPSIERAPLESIGLSQTVRLGGKRRAEAEAAGSAAASAAEEFRRRRLDLSAAVEREFARLLGAQERERIAAENLATAREMHAAVLSLVEAGEASAIEGVRAQNEMDLAEIDLRTAEQERADARGRLTGTLGVERADIGSAAGELPETAAVPDEAAVLSAVGGLPDVGRWREEARGLEASLDRARREAIPDPTLSFGMKRYQVTREKAYFASVSIPLPLLNRNRGGIVEASAKLDRGRLEMRAEEVRLRTAASAACSALRTSAGEVEALRERILPNAERVYAAVHEGYQRGKFRLLDLLEARRALAGLRLRFVDACVRLSLAKTDLDRLTAIEVPDLEESAP